MGWIPVAQFYTPNTDNTTETIGWFIAAGCPHTANPPASSLPAPRRSRPHHVIPAKAGIQRPASDAHP